MPSSYKPQAYSSVSPYLIVDGASRTIDFLVQVFDAVELRRFPDPTGKIMHAEVRIDDTVVMLADGGCRLAAHPRQRACVCGRCRRNLPTRIGRRRNIGAGTSEERRRRQARRGEGRRRHDMVDRDHGGIGMPPLRDWTRTNTDEHGYNSLSGFVRVRRCQVISNGGMYEHRHIHRMFNRAHAVGSEWGARG